MSADIPARFAVVGCRECRTLWIAVDRHHHDSATCPQCETTHSTKRLRPLAQADELDVACELRSRILAERADQLDVYATEDDYAILGERADEHLARYDDVGTERAEAYLHEQELLFEAEATAYLDAQETLFETEAEDYLDRQQRELNRLVEQSVSTPETPDALDTDSTPFTEQADPSHPEQAGITLTTPETLPEATDVRLTDPPIAPTKLWKRLWQTGDLTDRLRDALDTLRGASYRDAWATLTEAGATAPTNADHPAYIEFILDALKHPDR
ncbi:DUF5817 domain-containing protein [Halocatena marina]|uniref:DUF5817 domain-containing protein n=1 Tax=Halocatena marina TaxID=2934937 RepID=UPI003606692A